MPRSRKVDKVSSQMSNGSQNKRTAKAKNKKPRSNSRNIESDVLTQMKEKGYDGKQFVDQLKAGVQDQLKRRGKPPRIVRYFFCCGWAHAVLRNSVGPSDAEYAFPLVVLEFIRQIAPGDIKGEIREVHTLLIWWNSVRYYKSQSLITGIQKIRTTYLEIREHRRISGGQLCMYHQLSSRCEWEQFRSALYIGIYNMQQWYRQSTHISSHLN